ncbi:MAG: 4Fe-4S ferredoxin [Spirochaetae bacterium HGW-Spirochaetae-1]|jgi:ferredoxin|nr:MAG: 4Fe-4S ferredoxin [Spirochaetae bacterium HGW-Spirochaetae-1]
MFYYILMTLCGIAVLHLALVVMAMIKGEKGFRILPSTKKFAGEFSLWELIYPRYFQHGYVYFRWLKRYVSFGLRVMKVPVVGPFLIKKFIVPGYHGKVVTGEEVGRIITLNHEVPLHDVGENIVPYPVARDLLIGSPLEIVLMDCPCRASRPDPCLPLDVCMIVGQPFTDFVLEHRPEISRRISHHEALEILEAEHRRGHVHSLWFKEAAAGRFFAICNCCRCCCVGLELVNRLGINIMSSSGRTARVNEESCTGCLKCLDACPFGAISSRGTVVSVEDGICQGCGLCIDACPSGALCLEENFEGVMPLEMD